MISLEGRQCRHFLMRAAWSSHHEQAAAGARCGRHRAYTLLTPRDPCNAAWSQVALQCATTVKEHC